MRKIKFLLASLVFLLAACSNEKSQAERAFMDACRASGAGKAICSCSMDRLEEKYPGAQFVAINKSPTQQSYRDAMAAGAACLAQM